MGVYKMKNFISLFLGIMLIMQSGFAQEEYKNEFRATWIATVGNIDWPKSATRNNPEAQKAELIRMLDLYESINLNAVLLQVRTECDAFYNSAYEPWSRFLTWNQGDYPGYDPLQFAIDEAHKRGIELHAWINPYRINYSASDGGTYYDETHIYSEHPEWAIEYASGKKILNPGRPEVMSYIGAVIRDLVSNYAVDGIHFDDYFYSYDGTPAELDAVQYAAYGGGLDLDDWRRQNVNRMIDTVYKVIQEENPGVRFGVSPFGIYKSGVPSGISGMDAYSVIYCDPLAWLQNGSVDYLTPQLYWPTGGAQDFETLANWWSDQVFTHGRHFYPGHGTYRLADNPAVAKSATLAPSFNSRIEEADNYYSTLEMGIKGTSDPVSAWTLSEVGKQIDIMRSNHAKNALGSVFYSSKDFDRVSGLAQYILDNKYTHKSLWPEMIWKTITAPKMPENLTSIELAEGLALTWDYSGSESDRIAVYLSNNALDAQSIIDDPVNLVKLVNQNQVLFSDLDLASNSRIVVTAISPTGKESAPSLIYQPDLALPEVTLLGPDEGTVVAFSDELSWESNIAAASFYLQIATNESFGNIVYNSGWISDSIIKIESLPLKGETIYYWRVKAKDAENEGAYSVYQSIVTGFPAVPEIIKPYHLQQDLPQQPVIEWNASLLADEVEVFVSEDYDFSVLTTSESFDAGTNQGTLSTALSKNTWYNLKIKALNTFGESGFSDVIVFKIAAGEKPTVNLLEPADETTVASFDNLVWETPTTEGTITFKLEVAVDASFNSIIYNSNWVAESSLGIEQIGLEGNRLYYWRVKAKSEFGEGEYSEIRNFLAGYPARPAISQPVHLSENVDINPLVVWSAAENTDSIIIEFSEASSYNPLSFTGMLEAAPGQGQLNQNLKPQTYYYLRIKAQNEFGTGIYSSNKYFKTGTGNAISSSEDHSVELFPNLLSQGTAELRLNLPNSSRVSIKIINMVGQTVSWVQEPEVKPAGFGRYFIEASAFKAKGVYYVQISIDNSMLVKRLVVY
ncbi:MAG: family 10 glycosylhydrolase [Salinivirgaceae bacterium]